MYGSTSIKNVQLVGCRLLPEVATLMESSSIRTVSPALIVKQVLMESSSLKMGNSSVRAAMLLIRNIAQLVRKSSQPTVLSQTATCTMQSAWSAACATFLFKELTSFLEANSSVNKIIRFLWLYIQFMMRFSTEEQKKLQWLRKTDRWGVLHRGWQHDTLRPWL